jgi:hypothetical protein
VRCAVRAAFSGATQSQSVIRVCSSIRSARSTRPGTSQRNVPTPTPRPTHLITSGIRPALHLAARDLIIRSSFKDVRFGCLGRVGFRRLDSIVP